MLHAISMIRVVIGAGEQKREGERERGGEREIWGYAILRNQRSVNRICFLYSYCKLLRFRFFAVLDIVLFDSGFYLTFSHRHQFRNV